MQQCQNLPNSSDKCSGETQISYDFSEPINIFQKIPSDFNQMLDSQKWQERKSALESLLKILENNPRIADSANYADLISKLTRVSSRIIFVIRYPFIFLFI